MLMAWEQITARSNRFDQVVPGWLICCEPVRHQQQSLLGPTHRQQCQFTGEPAVLPSASRLAAELHGTETRTSYGSDSTMPSLCDVLKITQE